MTGEKCLVKDCDGESGTRGLCSHCYMTARQMINLGQATEEQVIKQGLMLPKKNKENLFKKQFISK